MNHRQDAMTMLACGFICVAATGAFAAYQKLWMALLFAACSMFFGMMCGTIANELEEEGVHEVDDVV
jgi:hypothetical protein